MKTLFLCVGDASGDDHCAPLVREVLARHSDWQIVGLAGPRCEEAGAKILGSTQGMGVIGFVSALFIWRRSALLHQLALRWLGENRVDGAILCDWGGFNTRMLPDFQQLEIPVCYYFPPRSWQKGGDAGTQIAPLVRGVATPFEWSAKKLKLAGADAHWVGHPILETIAALPSREELRAGFGFAPDETAVALLAGSRDMEIRAIAPNLFRTVERLRAAASPNARKFRFLFAAPPGGAKKIEKLVPSRLRDVIDRTIEGQTLELLRAADVGIIKSGTSTLQAAALDLPQVVVYDGPWFIRAQVSLTGLRRKIPLVAMPNIILDKMACSELLGNDCRAPQIVAAVLNLLDSPEKMAAMRADYALVRKALGSELTRGATKITADLVEEMVSPSEEYLD